MLSVEASKVRGDHNRVKIRRNSWCIVFATMLVSKLRLQRGVSAFLAFPSRGSRQRFVSNLQISQDLAFQGDRVDPVFVQQFRSILYSSSSSSLEATITYECIFDIQVPEGRCVGLQLADLPDDHPDALRAENFSGNNNTHWIYDRLHLDEVNYGVSLHNKNHRRSFWLGRLAMRHALLDQSKKPWDLSINGGSSCSSSILKDLHGRPQVPTGFLGSISHKRNMGVALVARIDNDSARSPPKVGLGVDIEETTTGERRSVARKVLTPFEQADLGRIPVSAALCCRNAGRHVLFRVSNTYLYVSLSKRVCQPKRKSFYDSA